MIPNDHSHQVTSQYYLDLIFSQQPRLIRVMDFGCGAGNSFEYFKRQQADIQWVLLDIEHSPEVASSS